MLLATRTRTEPTDRLLTRRVDADLAKVCSELAGAHQVDGCRTRH